MSKEKDVLFQAARRRTFAIISHPDAGKTTLTEKFLLYAGAVQEAGAVKARAGARSSTSDWMALERERGISISSTVLQFPYRDHVFNLLDTPGHKDFSEDTYRVLAAVDAVVMVLDIAKGIESQTLKLFQVCRSRNLPVLTFFNKYDRPGRDPLELLDEVEKQIGLRPTPATWPVGIPGDFRGVIDRRTNEFIRFTRTARGGSAAPEEIVPNDRAATEEGPAWQAALEGCALLNEIGANVDLESFLAGETTPVFVGSALTNFGVRMLLDAVIDLAPAAVARQNLAGEPQPLDNEFSAFVFKIQANMNPRHRDLLAFARVCTGRFRTRHGCNLFAHRKSLEHEICDVCVWFRSHDYSRCVSWRCNRSNQRDWSQDRRHALHIATRRIPGGAAICPRGLCNGATDREFARQTISSRARPT